MRVTIRKWGNSLALRIPKSIADDVGVGPGSVVNVDVSRGKLVAERVGEAVPRLADLLARVTARNIPAEVDTGPRVGREAW
jgi:antitoxin MazE